MRRSGFYLLVGLTGFLQARDMPSDGEAVYAKYCASCHGEKGEGVEDEADEPLRGERSLESLARYIGKRMPEDEPELVVGEDAERVAKYIYDAFYSPEAVARTEGVPKPAFARLTNRQFRESVADLIASFGQKHAPGEGTGLSAQYFQSDGMNKKANKVIERQDTRLEFDFGDGPPGEGITADQFSIAWDGSFLAPETGWYEFRLSTPNGARLYLNGDREAGDGNSRDDSGAKRQTALIDEWVSSGTEVRQTTERIFLSGGRGYPLRVDYFKYKDPCGSVRVDWKAPGGEWEVLARPYLSPAGAGENFRHYDRLSCGRCQRRFRNGNGHFKGVARSDNPRRAGSIQRSGGASAAAHGSA